MAVTVTITLTNADATRAVHALCAPLGAAETQANAKQALIDYIKQRVRDVEYQDSLAALAPTTDVQPT